MTNIDKYIKIAEEKGAATVKVVTPDEIVFDGRTLLKCMFGCDTWGKGPTCPSRPGALKPWEYEPLLRKYKHVLIIHAQDKKVSQNASYEVERAAFLDGDALAFSMSDCALCAECFGAAGKPCKNPRKARPAFHSIGIDVFSTVHKLGLPLVALKSEDEPQNWYSAVWLN